MITSIRDFTPNIAMPKLASFSEINSNIKSVGLLAIFSVAAVFAVQRADAVVPPDNCFRIVYHACLGAQLVVNAFSNFFCRTVATAACSGIVFPGI